MKEIILVVEGGGSRDLDSALREAIDRMLSQIKDKVRQSRGRWRTIPAGGRPAAWDKFLDLTAKNPDALVLLLVDSEESLATKAWTQSVWATRAQSEPRLFFMIQCMEAWIVADPTNLQAAYPNKLKTEPLPKRPPEECSPEDLRQALRAATQACGIGRYEKQHGPILLNKVDPNVVVARCPSFKTLLDGLDALI